MSDLLSSNPSIPSTADSEQTDIRYFLPELGSWAVLTIDPVASLSEGAQEVPEAVDACKRMINKPYVALVEHNHALYLPWEPFNSYSLRLLQQGDPYPIPQRCIEPYMSVPVLPVTKETHISGRPPLQSSGKALPWSDCFLSISGDTVVRSPSVWGPGPALWKIDRAERRRIRESMRDDIVDARNQRNAAMAAEKKLEVGAVDLSPGPLTPPAIADEAVVGTVTEVPSLHIPTRSDSGGQSSVYASSRNSEPYDDESDSDTRDDERGGAQEDDQEPLDLVEHFFFNRLHEKAMTTVRFTHDLSTVTELNDARDYYKEVEAIKRIEQEAAPRIEECRALRLHNKIQRAKEMDAAVYDEPTIDRLFERPSATENHIAQELPKGKSTAAGSKARSTASQDKKPIAQIAADAASVSDQEKSIIEAICEGPAQASSPTLILRIKSMLKKSGRFNK